MEIFCPECMGTVIPSGDASARCTICGASFSVLFNDSAQPQPGTAVISASGMVTATANPGLMCHQHPGVQAMYCCSKCSAPVCKICDFEMPGGLHMCPACATTPQMKLAGKRKSFVWWSIGLAIWSSLAFVILGICIALSKSSSDAGGFCGLLAYFTFLPSIIGMALGIASIDRRLTNPAIVWIAAIWNGVLLISLPFVLVMVFTLIAAGGGFQNGS